jgi:CBS domain-containing protein
MRRHLESRSNGRNDTARRKGAGVKLEYGRLIETLSKGAKPMQIREIMTREPLVIGPDMVLKEAAERMRDLDSGVMPVGQNDRLVGMLTDRDITIRATAAGKGPNETRGRRGHDARSRLLLRG